MRVLQTVSVLVFSLALLVGCNEEQTVNSIPVEVADVANIHHPTSQHFTAGQPTEAQLKTFAELGVTHVINLRGWDEMETIDEATWVNNAGMSYSHLPIASSDFFNRENVAEFHRLMNENDDTKVLVHCASSNRVGAMTALRAAWFQGANKDEALALGRKYGLKSLEPTVEKLLSE